MTMYYKEIIDFVVGLRNLQGKDWMFSLIHLHYLEIFCVATQKISRWCRWIELMVISTFIHEIKADKYVYIFCVRFIIKKILKYP